MEKIWVNRAESFEAAESFDREYYRNLSAIGRLETLQQLREAHFRASGLILADENGKRLRGVFRVIKQQ